ncbi:MAG: class I SAM-dependent methyltransferase [Planctomycetota bacterium]
MSHDPTQRFSDRVDAYVRYRPGYPDQAVQWVLERAGLDQSGVIADVGSGTGIFTKPMLQHGHQVFAVEPNAPMRTYAEQTLSGFEGFVSVNGSAEATALDGDSVDLVTAAQAYHWFANEEARVEFVRILKPGGNVALLWNDRVTTGDPFHVEYESLLKEHATDYERVNHQNLDDTDFDRFFADGYECVSFDNAQRLSLDGLIGRAESSSYMPGAGHLGHAAMIDALIELFDRFSKQDMVVIAYQTTVRIGRVD